MAFTTEEQEIIKWGVQNQKSKDDVMEALSNYRKGVPAEPVAEDSDVLEPIGQNPIKQGADQAWQDVKGAALGSLGQIKEAFTTKPKNLAEAVYKPFQVGGGIATLLNPGLGVAAGKVAPLVPKLADVIAPHGSRALQELVSSKGGQLAEPTEQKVGEVTQNVLGTVGLIAGGQLTKGALNKPSVKAEAQVETAATPKRLTTDIEAVDTMIANAPAQIMQRVARVTKGKQAKFKQMAGESVGEYLTKRNIYGNTEQLTTKLYDRFINSRTEADKGFAKLPGLYKPVPVKTMAEELVSHERAVSPVGAPSRDLARSLELQKKLNSEGLTMSEINELKRMYEFNVKTDYFKTASTKPENISRANNLDSAVRDWQSSQAELLGFKNLREVNRETRLAKRLLDDIGIDNAGSAGNNAVTLTDWIMLSGGDPTAIAATLVKKGMSSQTIRSAIAEYLAQGQETIPEIKANVEVTPEAIKRGASPYGLEELPPGGGGANVQINTPILQPTPKAIQSGTEVVPKSATQTMPPLLEKGLSPFEDSLQQSTPKSSVKGNRQGGYINFSEFHLDDINFFKKLINKKPADISDADFKIAQDTLATYGLTAPNTKSRLADFVKTGMESQDQATMDASIEAGMKRVNNPVMEGTKEALGDVKNYLAELPGKTRKNMGLDAFDEDVFDLKTRKPLVGKEEEYTNRLSKMTRSVGSISSGDLLPAYTMLNKALMAERAINASKVGRESVSNIPAGKEIINIAKNQFAKNAIAQLEANGEKALANQLRGIEWSGAANLGDVAAKLKGELGPKMMQPDILTHLVYLKNILGETMPELLGTLPKFLTDPKVLQDVLKGATGFIGKAAMGFPGEAMAQSMPSNPPLSQTESSVPDVNPTAPLSSFPRLRPVDAQVLDEATMASMADKPFAYTVKDENGNVIRSSGGLTAKQMKSKRLTEIKMTMDKGGKSPISDFDPRQRPTTFKLMSTYGTTLTGKEFTIAGPEPVYHARVVFKSGKVRDLGVDDEEDGYGTYNQITNGKRETHRVPGYEISAPTFVIDPNDPPIAVSVNGKPYFRTQF